MRIRIDSIILDKKIKDEIINDYLFKNLGPKALCEKYKLTKHYIYERLFIEYQDYIQKIKQEKEYNEILSKKFGKLKPIKGVLSIYSPKGGERTRYECDCDCGNKTLVLKSHLLSGDVKSCGCLKRRIGNENVGFRGYQEISQRYWLGSVIRHACSRKIEIKITIEQAWDLFLKQNKKCAISGIILNFTNANGIKQSQTASLDRIDSNKDYTLDNVQWIHKDLNTMKWDFSQDEFIRLCHIVSDFQRASTSRIKDKICSENPSQCVQLPL